MHIRAFLERPRSRTRNRRNSVLCIPCTLLWNPGGKFHVSCFLGFLVGASVLAVARFEAVRLTTHVLRSPCTVLSWEVLDLGTCTLCDEVEPAHCEVHPIATARLAVTFRPQHAPHNVTGYVWYCKGRDEMDPCDLRIRYTDQMYLDAHLARVNPTPCTTGEVFAYMQMHAPMGGQHHCYYNSHEPFGDEVWLTMPSPSLVGTDWFMSHMEYPVLLTLGGVVMLSMAVCCLATDGAELWASGLI
mmetsp:Transcript_82539/g.230144  ORF Transcript_82539/g.230144 Transcript_82539/m.230144 type:complete len:244 (-) Transcript_82539:300-1031(-)